MGKKMEIKKPTEETEYTPIPGGTGRTGNDGTLLGNDSQNRELTEILT